MKKTTPDALWPWIVTFTLISAGPLLLAAAYLDYSDSLLHVAAAIAVAFLASWAACKLIFPRAEASEFVKLALESSEASSGDECRD